jgi:hypothetical protein
MEGGSHCGNFYDLRNFVAAFFPGGAFRYSVESFADTPGCAGFCHVGSGGLLVKTAA